MIVKAKYHKEIEVIDEITKEEIDRIPLYGMPDRFDCMADQIDNEQPLELDYWEYVKDDNFRPPHIKSKSRTNLVIRTDIIIGIVFAIMFGLVWGIFKQSVSYGIFISVLYILIWFPISIAINWIRKVNKHMKGDNK